MAPEQPRGEAVDQRADVFALGAILESIARAAPVLPSRARRDRTDPAARYLTCRRWPLTSAGFSTARAVEAHRESLFDRLARFGRRYRLPILLVLTYLVDAGAAALAGQRASRARAGFNTRGRNG